MGSCHDFDFLMGTWTVHHRRLVNQLDPRCTESIEFESVATVKAILDGLGTVDETEGTLPGGDRFSGHTLRLYDPEEDLWRIWWASLARPGVLDPPVEGRFIDGVGVFEGPFEHDGQTIIARFFWRETSGPEPVWEQEFSFDGGRSWAPINWTMTHRRSST